MHLAKPCVDIALNTNALESMLTFWQHEACLRFDHVLPIRPGMKQHRHNANGSVLKINHYRELLRDTPPSGYVELLIARPDLAAPMPLIDPDGNHLKLVPKGYFGVTQIGIQLAVRDLDAHSRFYADALGLAREPRNEGAAFRASETLLLLDRSADAPTNATLEGKGWRYITFQVFACDSEHRRILEHGGREALAPRTLGDTARISMVRDPDGNWIEVSQRASITGSLKPQ